MGAGRTPTGRARPMRMAVLSKQLPNADAMNLRADGRLERQGVNPPAGLSLPPAPTQSALVDSAIASVGHELGSMPRPPGSHTTKE
jgi:hypothetical protein